MNWADRFNNFCFLDNNNYEFGKSSFECILAAGASRSIQLTPGNAYPDLKAFYQSNPSWVFGHFSYELKNETEVLPVDDLPRISFGPGFFFMPSIVIKLGDGKLSITSTMEDPARVMKSIEECVGLMIPSVATDVSIKHSISRDDYIENVKKLIGHIHRGDCYEINYCQHFFAKDAIIDPLYIYKQLTDFSPNPFAALYKLNNKYCLCASPERYLKKTGHTIFSQPMKGTSRRLPGDDFKDAESRKYLLNSNKEKSENVMVVDLVRNDLSKICVEGSVKVDELFGIYTFPQVHQMISTISGILKPGIHWTDAIKATFPMGSMTGAPKKKVMELISR
ncbi:MAG TPA: chorismate-binding protein, partial [Ferruginibacter sp.]|nr:chorismate-binding protein [Ferruginibacter sp.]